MEFDFFDRSADLTLSATGCVGGATYALILALVQPDLNGITNTFIVIGVTESALHSLI